MPPQPKPSVYIDTIGTMEKGVNQGQAPNLLKNNQLASSTNVTVRGDYVNNRPPIVKIPFTFNDPTIQPLLSGYYQGGCFYLPDFGASSLMAAISGRLLQFQISGNTCTVSDQSIPGDYNTSAPTQSWLWQSENYVIVNDGVNLPLFFNGGSTVRSNGPAITYGNPAGNSGSSLASNFTVPAVGSSATITLNSPGYTGILGSNILIDNELYQTVSAGGYSDILTNLSDTPGNTVPNNSQILSEPSVWGVTTASATVGAGNYAQGATFTTLQITRATAKVGDVILATFTPYSQLQFKVTSVNGTSATIANDSGGTVGVLSGKPITLAKGAFVYFAANNQPNVKVNTTTASFVVPAVGQTVTVPTNGPYSGKSGASVYIGTGQYSISAGPITAGGLTLTVINISDSPGTGSNTRGPTGSVGLGVVTSVPQLPAGRMGVYDLGRNWMCLTDGQSYIASDIVGGTSGTPQNQFRDAVLNITENTFLFEGGVFKIPGNGQQITAMNFAATLDASLGQGPVQIGTQTKMVSNNAPVDRTTWESITNPIQTESLISNGPLAQNSTILMNGDIWFRAVDGWRSLILGRRDFSTWGNVPQSREVQNVINADNPALLNWGSVAVFDNRALMTANPTTSTIGVYHPVTIALNNDPLSSLNVKQPSVYDGIWTGGANSNLNVLQWLTGIFNGVQRCFAFCANLNTVSIELWEILSDAASISTATVSDNGSSPIVMDFTTAMLLDGLPEKTIEDYCRLADGEMAVDQVAGPCTFQVLYKPDEYNQWVPWYSWSVDGKNNFYPRMGFGEPDGTVYDKESNRPLRNGYGFQIRFVITGPCQMLYARIKAVPEPQPDFAPQLQPTLAFTANLNTI